METDNTSKFEPENKDDLPRQDNASDTNLELGDILSDILESSDILSLIQNELSLDKLTKEDSLRDVSDTIFNEITSSIEDYKASIIINKQDEYGEYLEGSVFMLCSCGHCVKRIDMTEKCKTCTICLYPGVYTLTEVSAPECYIKMDGCIELMVIPSCSGASISAVYKGHYPWAVTIKGNNTNTIELTIRNTSLFSCPLHHLPYDPTIIKLLKMTDKKNR